MIILVSYNWLIWHVFSGDSCIDLTVIIIITIHLCWFKKGWYLDFVSLVFFFLFWFWCYFIFFCLHFSFGRLSSWQCRKGSDYNFIFSLCVSIMMISLYFSSKKWLRTFPGIVTITLARISNPPWMRGDRR